jgi:hypothetical protein
MKVLFCGDCSALAPLQARLARLQASSAGPFDVCFVTSLAAAALEAAAAAVAAAAAPR